MKSSTIVWIVIVLIIIIAGAWYFIAGNQAAAPTSPNGQTQTNNNPGTSDYYPNGAPGNTATQTSAAPALLAVGSSATIPTFLTAQNGMTLYTFANDKAGVSNCTGQCASLWPPYSVPDGATLSGVAGITGTFGTMTRADGSIQATYNGSPLYFYSKDTKAGDTNGQGIGGVWYVATP